MDQGCSSSSEDSDASDFISVSSLKNNQGVCVRHIPSEFDLSPSEDDHDGTINNVIISVETVAKLVEDVKVQSALQHLFNNLGHQKLSMVNLVPSVSVSPCKVTRAQLEAEISTGSEPVSLVEVKKAQLHPDFEEEDNVCVPISECNKVTLARIVVDDEEERDDICCSPGFNTSFKYNYNINMDDVKSGTLFDTHCHLDFLFRRLYNKGELRSKIRFEDLLSNCLSIDSDQIDDKFGGCVANFCDPRDWSTRRGVETMRTISSSDERVHLAIGCHPHFADSFGGKSLGQLSKLISRFSNSVVALGECGLDYSKKNIVAVDHQKRVFFSQVKLALRLKLPLVLHIREAEEDGYKVLTSAKVPSNWPIHRHCFNGRLSEAQTWIARYPNSRLGVTGLVTYKEAVRLHQVVTAVPLNKLLLETDSPYFPPSKVRGRDMPSLPGQVIHVAAMVATLKKVSLDTVLQANLEGVKEVYKVDTVNVKVIKKVQRMGRTYNNEVNKVDTNNSCDSKVDSVVVRRAKLVAGR